MSAHRTDSELRESHLPPPAASWGEISDFAGTFWAYEYWGDAGRCHQVALGIHRSYAQEGRLPEGLPELRTALFMEQRRTVHTGSPPEGERLTYVRALVEEIRSILRRRAAAGFHRRGSSSRVYVPPDYDPSLLWPCVVFLHGVGENGTDGEKPLTVGLGPALREASLPAIVIFPQCRGPWKFPADEVLEILELVRREFSIDPDRIYLTGLSQGGCSTYDLVATHPDLWAAAVVVCGAGRPADAPRLARVPIWAFHGGRDEAIPPSGHHGLDPEGVGSRDLAKLIPGLRYTEFPEEGHAIWDRVYRDPAVWKWLFERNRVRHPFD